jgi:hypothetical protein
VEPGEPNDLVVTKRPHVELRLRHRHVTLAPFGPENDRREHSLMSVAKAPDLVRERAEPVADRAADCSKPTSPPTPAGIDRPRRAHELCIIGEQLAETGNVATVPSLVEGANRLDAPSRQGSTRSVVSSSLSRQNQTKTDGPAASGRSYGSDGVNGQCGRGSSSS